MVRMRRTRYRRSTPVIRLRRNVGKIIYHTSLVLDRLRLWQQTGDARVEDALLLASEVAEKSVDLDEMARGLENGFVPPKRPSSYQPEVGHRVRVLPKYRSKYEILYESQLGRHPDMLDDLLVARLLPSGEVMAHNGHFRNMTILVRKTHVARVLEEG